MDASPSSPPLRIVFTGATSGIGLQAALRLRAIPGTHLVIAARNPAHAPAPLRDGITFETVDLESLASVRELAFRLLAGPPIDRLLLNAGMQTLRASNSADGFALTFAVNHLAHYLLARLLLSHMAPNGRIIFTSSGTHNPGEKTGVPPPAHADAARLANPAIDPDNPGGRMRAGQFAYSSSKLCNVMTARELARRTAAPRPDLMIAAFDPGFTPGTGLARQYGAVVSTLFRFVLPLVVRGGRVSTPLNSGTKLAALATDPAYADARGTYYAVRGPVMNAVEPSELARDEVAAARLWDDSAAMVGLRK
jgi:NAD(P)-dependent dehydrogenase (short-subunit alcohol dehydrogenase family)